MKTTHHFRSLLNLSCSLLASLWLVSPAREAPAPQPSTAEGIGPSESVDGGELLEKLTAERGEVIDRSDVGGLGFISKLVMEGNTVISEKPLRRALATDMEVVLASHPAANLADFLRVISDQLVSGYHNCGFPETKVEAEFDAKPEGGRIVVRIHEGPRYRMGKIQIESAGDTALNSDKLIEKLLEKPEAPSAGTLADILRESMDAYGYLLPQPEAETPEDLREALNQQDPTASSGIASGSNPGPRREHARCPTMGQL